MQPSIPYSHHRGEPDYAGYHFSTGGQVPGPTSFSPHFPEADPNLNVASEWRIHTRWVNHAEDGGLHPTYGNDAYGGGSVPCYGPNHAIAGSWGTPAAPQTLQNSDYSMVSVFHKCLDSHPLIPPSHEAKHSIQQPRTGQRPILRVPLRYGASPGSFDSDELLASPPRGGPQSKCPFRMGLPHLLSAIRRVMKSIWPWLSRRLDSWSVKRLHWL